MPASSGPGTAGGIVAVVAANVALAFGPLFVRVADVGPVAAAFWRMLLAVPLIALAAVVAQRRATAAPAAAPVAAMSRRTAWLLALSGIAFAADLGSWHLGIVHTTMANATLFGNSATFIFPLWGFLVARAWPTRQQGAALVLAALGAGLLMGRSYQMDPRLLMGDLLSLAAGLLYAIYFILMADVRRTMAPLRALAWSSSAALLPLLALAWLLGERVLPGDWTPLIGLALVSQVVGQGCMTYALGTLSPLLIGLALLIQPLVAAAIGRAMFGERLGLADMAGAAMVAIALVLVRRAPEPATEPQPPANPVPEDMR